MASRNYTEWSRFLSLLPQTTIAAAVTAVVTTPVTQLAGVRELMMQAQFLYGSWGTTAKAWVQTSFDGGTTWVDVACFSFTTAAATKISAVKTFTAVAAAYVATDGTLTADTIKDGLIGDQVRVKYTTTGTYAGATSLTVTAVAKG